MFIGQEKILNELNYIVPRILDGDNMNILLVAPSGYGKTFLGFYLLSLAHGNFWYYLPDKKEIEIKEEKRFQFIDEAHTLSSFEFLYPIMDSEQHIFIFATNEFGELPEPLWRRCIRFIFEPYTNEDMGRLVNYFLELVGIILPGNLTMQIANVCKRNPGTAKIICQRLSYVFKGSKIPENEEELDKILTSVLNIQGGLNELDRRYLNSLGTLGQASLDRISAYSRIPKTVILRDIEPYLLEENIISITSRGRKLNEN